MSILKQTLVWQLFSAPLIISGDEGLIVKAFHNLLHNAILYTPPGGHITICTGRLNNQVVYLKISDDGIGMEQEQLPHIFERFYKINQARTTNGSGAGLGLTIVKKIVDMHHGRVVVDSTPGNGSTFSLHFPNHEAILAPAIVDNYL